MNSMVLNFIIYEGESRVLEKYQFFSIKKKNPYCVFPPLVIFVKVQTQKCFVVLH